MPRYRSILAVFLALVATVLVSCGSPTAAKPPTYTAAQLEQIQKYTPAIAQLRDRMDNLQTLIQQKNWTDVSTYIHGPLGELRRNLSLVSRSLLPTQQAEAKEISKGLFKHLEDIGAAAQTNSYSLAVKKYKDALADFDAFLKLIPES